MASFHEPTEKHVIPPGSRVAKRQRRIVQDNENSSQSSRPSMRVSEISAHCSKEYYRIASPTRKIPEHVWPRHVTSFAAITNYRVIRGTYRRLPHGSHNGSRGGTSGRSCSCSPIFQGEVGLHQYRPFGDRWTVFQGGNSHSLGTVRSEEPRFSRAGELPTFRGHTRDLPGTQLPAFQGQ
jgi:hypothetical protein